MPDDKLIQVPYRGGILSARTAEHAAEAIASMERSRKRQVQKVERWGADNGEQMRRLCASLPCLRDMPGTSPWDVHTFLSWALGPAPSSGGWHAARFVLHVWCDTEDWDAVARELGLREEGDAPIPVFNLSRALSVWDEAHHAAFMAWCELPFFP